MLPEPGVDEICFCVLQSMLRDKSRKVCFPPLTRRTIACSVTFGDVIRARRISQTWNDTGVSDWSCWRSLIGDWNRCRDFMYSPLNS